MSDSKINDGLESKSFSKNIDQGLDFLHFLAFVWHSKKMILIGSLSGAVLGTLIFFASQSRSKVPDGSKKIWEIYLRFSDISDVSDSVPNALSNYSKMLEEERNLRELDESGDETPQDRQSWKVDDINLQSKVTFKSFRLHGQKFLITAEVVSDLPVTEVESAVLADMNNLVAEYNKYLATGVSRLTGEKLEVAGELFQIKMNALKAFESQAELPPDIKKDILAKFVEDAASISKVESIIFLLSSSQLTAPETIKITEEYSLAYERYLIIQQRFKNFLKIAGPENSGPVDFFSKVDKLKPVEMKVQYTTGEIRNRLVAYVLSGLILGGILTLGFAGLMSFFHANEEKLKTLFADQK